MKTPTFTPAEAAQIEAGLRHSAADPGRMGIDDITYALAKQVPDMEGRGFTIGTSYGDIAIPPGRVADTVARAVTRALQCELLATIKRAQHAKRQEAGHVL